MKPCVLREKRSWFAAFSLALVCLFASILPAYAATLTNSPVVFFAVNQPFNVSVYPGQAGYTSTVSSVGGVFGDGEVLDYRFFRTAVGGGIDFNGYAMGTGLRVLAPTNGAVYQGGEDFNDANLWTTTAPEINFSSTPDYTTGTLCEGTDIKGEIDISGMYEGRFYVIGGYKYNSALVPQSLSAIMTGEGQPPITLTQSISRGDNYQVWEFIFAEAEKYDTISYTYTPNSSNRGRFMGLILDGELIPQGTLLIVR
jgi:hypothetical protein